MVWLEKTCRLSARPYLEDGIVGQGKHVRFIIDEGRFRDKMEQKKQ